MGLRSWCKEALVKWQEKKEEQRLFPDKSIGYFKFKDRTVNYKKDLDYVGRSYKLFQSFPEAGRKEGLSVEIFYYFEPFKKTRRFNVDLVYYKNSLASFCSSYGANYLRELPPEISCLVRELANACWEELEKQTKEKEYNEKILLEKALMKKEEILSEIGGVNGLLSPDSLTRWVAEKIKKK